MKLDEYDVLICGATMAGLGAAAAAAARKRTAIVVERTALAGNEFVEAFNPGRGEPVETRTSIGRELREDAVARRAMERGPMHLPALHPMLCRLAEARGIEVAFLTETVEVAARDGRYVATLLDASGLHRIVADEILDTTTRRLTEPGNPYAPAHRRLNAYLHRPDARGAAVPAPIDGAMSIGFGRFPSEVILRLSVPPKLNWMQARHWLYAYWEARPEAWAPWTIAAVAGAFESVVRRGAQRIAARWTWLPSEGFDHPLEAMDAGYDYLHAAAGRRDAAER